MASNTKNVKLGVCQVLFDGVDLGYTQGGVEVTVKTDTHKVVVDQFGKTSINEYIMGRECSAKVPLAETTIDNMVAIMPGATMTTVGGTAASGIITIGATMPVTNDTITVNGVVYTYKTTPVLSTDLAIPATGPAGATALAAVLNASTQQAVATAYYSATASAVTVTYGNQLIYGTAGKPGLEGNVFTLAKSGTSVTVSGANLTGGADSTSKSVTVTNGIGVDLLSIAKELRFHPVSKLATDFSEDFIMPLAATPGALKFAYKLENERVYDVDFTGFPDPVTGKQFQVGVAPQ
jgi:hypothetical protein